MYYRKKFGKVITPEKLLLYRKIIFSEYNKKNII